MDRLHKGWIKRLTNKPLPNKERHALITTLRHSTNATTIELGHMTDKALPAIPEYDPEHPGLESEDINGTFQPAQEAQKGLQGKEPPAADMIDYIRTLEKVDISREPRTDKEKVTTNTALQHAATKSLRMVSKTTSHITMALMIITTTTAHALTTQSDTQLRRAGEQTTIEGVHIRLATDREGNLLMGATSNIKKLHITHLQHEFRFTEAAKAERQLNNLIENTSRAHKTHRGTDFPEIDRSINLPRTLKEACDCHLTDTTSPEITTYRDRENARSNNTDRWVYNHTETAPHTCKRSEGPELYEVTISSQNNTCTINPTPQNKLTLIKKYTNMTTILGEPCIARGHYNLNQLTRNRTHNTGTATLMECTARCHFTHQCTVWMYNTATANCWLLSLDKAHTFTTTQHGTTYSGSRGCIPCELARHLETPPNCSLNWSGRPQAKIRCPCITKETLQRNMDSLKTLRDIQNTNSIHTNNQTGIKKQNLGRALNKILAQTTKHTISVLHQTLMGQPTSMHGTDTHLLAKEPLTSLKVYLSPAKIISIVRTGARQLYKLWKDSPPPNLHAETHGEITEYTAKQHITPLTTEGQLTNTELKRDTTSLAKFVSDSDIQKRKVANLKTLPNKLKPFYAAKTPQGAQAILITTDTGDTISKIAIIPTTTDEVQTEIAVLPIPTAIGEDHTDHPIATGVKQLTPNGAEHRTGENDRWHQTQDNIGTCFSQMAAGVQNPDDCSIQGTPEILKTTTILAIRTQGGPKRLVRLCHTNQQRQTIEVRCGDHTNSIQNKGVLILLLDQECHINSQTGEPIITQMTKQSGGTHTYRLLYNEELHITDEWQSPDETTASLLGVVITICLGIIADRIRKSCKQRPQTADTGTDIQRANSTNSVNAERRSPVDWHPETGGATEI
jgi:hypothetical protein